MIIGWVITVTLCLARVSPEGPCTSWEFIDDDEIFPTFEQCVDAVLDRSDILAGAWGNALSNALCGEVTTP